MKKSDQVDFSIPRRQSYSAIIFFIYRLFKTVVRQVWPIVLALLFGKESFKTTLIYVIIGVSFLILLYSVISFFKYYFYIQDDELIVEKGVFQKSKVNIPFERIQTINFEQSLLHQFFNVVKLEIDTAGSKGSEFSFAAIDQAMAGELRTLIMTKKTKSISKNSIDKDPLKNQNEIEVEKTVMTLSLPELIKIGLGQNHIRSFFLIVVFFSWILDQLNDIGFSADEVLNEFNNDALAFGQLAVIFLAFLAILITLLISLVQTILRYYNLSLIRTKDGFKVIAGLLNRRQVSAKDHKIQIVSWADNPIKRYLNMFDVYLKQASSIQVQNKKSIIIPGCNSENLALIKNYYFEPFEWEKLLEYKIDKRFITRRMLYGGLLPFIPIYLGVLYYHGFIYSLITILWLPLIYYSAIISYKKWKIKINQHILHIHHGLFGNYNKSLRIYKIQNISLRQSIYHQMHGLADIIIYTASGRLRIPFMPLKTAYQFVDFISYKIETDPRRWM